MRQKSRYSKRLRNSRTEQARYLLTYFPRASIEAEEVFQAYALIDTFSERAYASDLAQSGEIFPCLACSTAAGESHERRRLQELLHLLHLLPPDEGTQLARQVGGPGAACEKFS